ncbi:MAG: hypothetical protein RKE49_00065 [Oceanicaulis sp.]
MSAPVKSWAEGSLPSLAAFVAELSGAEAAAEAGLTVTTLSVDLPMELSLGVEDGAVRAIAAGPPTQRTETTVMPVFHRLRLTLALDDAERTP